MPSTPRTVFFSVGEPSGDLHGANLIRAFRRQDPDIRVVGFGGPKMENAGMTLHADLTQLAVMWVAQAILNVQKFWKLLRQADHYFGLQRPDAVVLIDYPGFNWWVARIAKKHKVPVFYYGAPQMWAWGSWRIRKMRRLVDHVICKLPFEAEWYRERGCNATYVGHPYFDELTTQELDHEFIRSQDDRRSGRLVTILPGSRTQEVENNLSWFLKAAKRVAKRSPGTRFAIASFNEKQADLARQAIKDCDFPIAVHVDRTSELIHLSTCCMACSGSVSLELMYRTRPSVILYWVNRFSYTMAKRLLRVRYMTLVNLLACEDRFERAATPYDPSQPGAEQVPFPEYPTYEDKSGQLANHIIEWLEDPVAHHSRVAQLTELKSRFCCVGATRTAADLILKSLSDNGSLPQAKSQGRAA